MMIITIKAFAQFFFIDLREGKKEKERNTDFLFLYVP